MPHGLPAHWKRRRSVFPVMDSLHSGREEGPAFACFEQMIDPIDISEECNYSLGLKLKKTQSFLDFVEMKLSEAGKEASYKKNKKARNSLTAEVASHGDTRTQQTLEKEKLKASKFYASFLQIGTWERIARYKDDLVVKLYYAKRKLVWEIMHCGRKSKMEIQWSDIAALRATFLPGQPDVLELELKNPPGYFRESKPQPRKHTLWQTCSDFTRGQAPSHRRHYLKCPEGTLRKPYEKLLRDKWLFSLSKGPFPSVEELYFALNFERPGGHLNHLERQRADLSPRIHSSLDNTYPPQFHQFGKIMTPSFPAQQAPMFNHLRQTNALMDSTSPCSVIAFPPIEDDGEGDHIEPQRPLVWIDRNQSLMGAIVNQNEQLVIPSTDNFIHHIHQQTPFSLSPLTNGLRQVSFDNTGELMNEFEQHLQTESLPFVCEDDHRFLAYVNTMCNLTNAGHQCNAPVELILHEELGVNSMCNLTTAGHQCNAPVELILHEELGVNSMCNLTNAGHQCNAPVELILHEELGEENGRNDFFSSGGNEGYRGYPTEVSSIQGLDTQRSHEFVPIDPSTLILNPNADNFIYEDPNFAWMQWR